MVDNVKFESSNIYYTTINKQLINDYLEMVNSQEVSKYISLKNRIFTYDDELEWIKNKLLNNSLIFSMIEKESNRFIGNIELMEINNNIGELAICITPTMQNKHYGHEAIERFIKYCFEELGLNNVELSVYSHNKKAINLYEKLGFVEYRREINIGTYNGQSIDDIYMKYEGRL